MVLIMLIRRSRVIAKVPRYASISICFFKRTPHNHTTKALPCRNATHPSPFGNTFPSRARSSSKPHNLALLVGTTSHSSGNRNLEPDTFSSRARSTPFPCFAKGRQTSLRPTPPTKRAAEMISHFCSSFVWMLFSRLQSLAAHPIFLLRISNQVLYLVSSPARHTQ